MPSADRRFYSSESDPDSSGIYVSTLLLRLQPLVLLISVIRRIVELLAIVLPGNAALDELVRGIDQREDVVEQRVGYRSARIQDQTVLQRFVAAARLQILQIHLLSVQLRIITTVHVQSVVLLSQSARVRTW